jgi:Tfp pilus assembly protein PilN
MRAVNLLTPDLRSAPKGKGASGPSALEAPGGIGAFVVLGALALVVAAVAGYVLSNNVIKDRKAELAQVSAQSDATVAKANSLKPYADFEQVAKDRAGTVQALAGARFDWEQALRDLSRAMPDDVYLSSLDGDVGGGTGASGGGGSSLRGAIQSPAINLKGCTKSQEAVATLMSRMRNVQGVTRVTLAKSDKDTAATGASGSSVNPCGKGNPPSFEMIIFFERSAVAQALSTATGAADTSSSKDASGSTGSGTAPKDGSASGQQSGQSGSSSSTSPSSSGSTPPAATTTGGTP